MSAAMRFFVKVIISALVIAGVSELSKRSSLLGAVFAALPLTSILVLIWLYLDTGDLERISKLSTGIFWALLPSFILLLSLPVFLKRGLQFPAAMTLSCSLMVGGYWAYVWTLGKLGIQF
jgi:uncharacterized membrane protein (GlpM family)